jgi:hypothetical protein
MRIYVVKYGDSERLVEANTPSQAVMHVASAMVSAKAAKAADVARVMAAGGKVEQITVPEAV